MPRIPYAAKTLVTQVGERYQRNDYRATDLDGLGVHRTLVFAPGYASTWLGKVVPLLNDPRIERFEMDKGQATITFVAGTRADDSARFPLDDATDVYRSLDVHDVEKDGQPAADA